MVPPIPEHDPGTNVAVAPADAGNLSVAAGVAGHVVQTGFEAFVDEYLGLSASFIKVAV